jgi:hypothetical protein
LQVRRDVLLGHRFAHRSVRRIVPSRHAAPSPKCDGADPIPAGDGCCQVASPALGTGWTGRQGRRRGREG